MSKRFVQEWDGEIKTGGAVVGALDDGGDQLFDQLEAILSTFISLLHKMGYVAIKLVLGGTGDTGSFVGITCDPFPSPYSIFFWCMIFTT